MRHRISDLCLRHRILKLLPFALLVVPVALASSPAELVKKYETEAKSQDRGFTASASRGQTFFSRESTHSSGKKMSCTTCHSSDAKRTGQTRAGKPIEPMAVSVNPARFTDPAKVEKWFGRNCNDVLERPCTPAEKADFIQYMISIK